MLVGHIFPSYVHFINRYQGAHGRTIAMSEGYVKVGQMGDFPAGALRKVTIGGEEVVIGNVGGQLYAIADKCTHRGGPLSEGELEGTTVTCPWHGGQFDMTNGKVLQPPPMTGEASYEVKVEASNVFLKKR